MTLETPNLEEMFIKQLYIEWDIKIYKMKRNSGLQQQQNTLGKRVYSCKKQYVTLLRYKIITKKDSNK